MKRLILLLWAVSLFAIPTELLKIESILFPKLLFFDKDLSQKISNETILFHIIYDEGNKEDAKKLSSLLNSQTLYGKKILSILLKEPIQRAPTAYILALSPSHVKQIIPKLNPNRLIFLTNPDMIEYGHITIYIGIKILPYINPWQVKKSHIKLDTTLLKIARFYEK